jgi:hypothetical protein
MRENWWGVNNIKQPVARLRTTASRFYMVALFPVLQAEFIDRRLMIKLGSFGRMSRHSKYRVEIRNGNSLWHYSVY